MLNPARGRAERGNREDTAPAPGEREAPTPTRGLVNQGRQIRDREQSRVSNPAHSKRGQGWREGKGPASKQRDPRSQGQASDPALGEREVPTPTRGLVNQSRQIRDREQSRVSNPAHSKRGQGWRGGKGPASKQRDPGSHGEASDGSIVPRTSRQSDAQVRQVGGRSSVKLVTARTQWRTRTHDGQKRIDMHALAYVDIHCTPRRLSLPCSKV